MTDRQCENSHAMKADKTGLCEAVANGTITVEDALGKIDRFEDSLGECDIVTCPECGATGCRNHDRCDCPPGGGA